MCKGAFSHSAGTAPIITLLIPGTTPPYRSVHDPFKTASGVRNSGPWDIGPEAQGHSLSLSSGVLRGSKGL